MQKLFTTSFLLFFIFNVSLAQNNHNDLKDVNLKGNIKSFGQCFLEGILIPLTDNDKICRIGIGNTYNEKGFLISSNSISYNATIVQMEYYYDTNGVLNAIDYYYPEKKTNKSFLITVKQDRAKNELSYWFYEGSILQSKTVFIRDDKGNLIVQRNYGNDEKLNQEKRYEYNSDNYRIKESIVNSPGYLSKSAFENMVNYQNDEHGNPITKTDVASKEKTTYVYEYDTVGNWLMRTSYNDKGEVKQLVEQYFEYY